uniref:Auxin-responsive protein SAUR32 n=1 Tax=Aegilops tauschii TaxID=37682 RepID=R7WEL1_AEGTA
MATPKGVRRSLVLRTLERCKSATGRSGGAASSSVAGCFSVYVGPERERFVGPLALPCDVGTFLDILWQMDHGHHHHHHHDGSAGGDEIPKAASPICGLLLASRGRCRAAGYRRMLSRAKTSLATGSSFSHGSHLAEGN